MPEFLGEKYFSGDLFLDPKRKTYEAMGYKKYNFCTLILALFSPGVREAVAKGREAGMKGNLRGYANQNGGVLIVKKGGREVLLSYRQDNPADHVENSDVLHALGIRDADKMLPEAQAQLKTYKKNE